MSEDALERYVKSAVRGLYGQRRAQVTRELRGNLEHRVGEFMAFGDLRERAVERALLEFGAAGEVARGLREVHVMPTLIKTGAVATLVCGLGLIFLTTQAQVLFSTNSPVNVCDTELGLTVDCKQLKPSWIEPLGFFRQLAPDIKVTILPQVPVRTFVINEEQNASSVSFGEGKNIQTREVPGLSLIGNNRQKTIPLLLDGMYFSEGRDFFLDTSIALSALIWLGREVTFTGLTNPIIRTKEGQVEIGNDKITVNIADFISERVEGVFDSNVYQGESILKDSQEPFGSIKTFSNNWRYNSASRITHFFKGVAQPNATYALLEWKARYPADVEILKLSRHVLVVDAVQADAAGNLKLVSNQYQLKFDSSLEGFKANPVWGKALVVKLTGRLDKDLLEPKGVLSLPESSGEIWKNYTEEK